MKDEDLYKQTLKQYNDPDFAKKYAMNIEDRLDEWQAEAFLKYLLPNAKILDAGCAAGRDTNYFVSKGYQAIGIDFSEALIKEAKTRYPNISFKIGDFTDLQFTEESFDGVWSHAGLVHLPNQKIVKTALLEFYRVLKNNGILMVLTKARLKEQPETTTRSDALSGAARFFRFQEQKEFESMLKDEGFEVSQSQLFNEMEGPKHKVMRDENWLFIIARKL